MSYPKIPLLVIATVITLAAGAWGAPLIDMARASEPRVALSSPLWQVEVEWETAVLVTAPTAQLAAARAVEDLDVGTNVLAYVEPIRGGEVTLWYVEFGDCLRGWTATAVEEVPDAD